jgi:hypothetical protein
VPLRLLIVTKFKALLSPEQYSFNWCGLPPKSWST